MASPVRPANWLLEKLPAAYLEQLTPHFTRVPLRRDQVLCEPNVPFNHVYFPLRGALSAVNLMRDGGVIETGTIGPEGMFGMSVVMGLNTSPSRVFVQVEGEAFRMTVANLKKELDAETPLLRLLQLYSYVFLTQITQTAACNGLHQVGPRCCRWILMTRDRYGENVIPLTHEFLGFMLGVRRSSVSVVLQPLQDEHLIDYSRGKIKILNVKGLEAKACECYRVVNDLFRKHLGTPWSFH